MATNNRRDTVSERLCLAWIISAQLFWQRFGQRDDLCVDRGGTIRTVDCDQYIYEYSVVQCKESGCALYVVLVAVSVTVVGDRPAMKCSRRDVEDGTRKCCCSLVL